MRRSGFWLGSWPPRVRWAATAAALLLVVVGGLFLLWTPGSASPPKEKGVQAPPASIPALAAPPVVEVEPVRLEVAIPVLMYHAISAGPNSLYVPPQELDGHLTYLKAQGFNAITLRQLYDHFERGARLPERPVVLTFDDGYADFYTAALPLLQKHQMVGTLFVITGKVGQPGYITWEQARAIAGAGIEIGSHTVSHPDLRNLEEGRQQQELWESRRLLEERLGVPVEFFAYPAGRYSDTTLTLIRKQYRGAVTTMSGVATPCQDFQLWRRIRVVNRLGPAAFGKLLRHWEEETSPSLCQPPARMVRERGGPAGPQP